MTKYISRQFIAAVVACFALTGFQSTASAAFIEGGIGFGGLFVPMGGTSGNLSDATGIVIGFSTVTTASGDFAGTVGSNASFNVVEFNPANTPITPLWTVTALGTTYSFDLFDISVDFQDTDELNLSGSGVLMANGFDDTPGAWTFSGQQGNILFTFSSITTAVAVVEPSMLFLMGIGFLGLAVARKRVS